MFSKTTFIALGTVLAASGAGCLGHVAFAGDGARPVAIAFASGAEPSGLSNAAQRPEVSCSKQAWPNLAPDCLTAADGTPARRIVRRIETGTR